MERMDYLQNQSSPKSAIVTSRDKRRIGLKTDQLKGTPFFVPNSQKSAPINQYAGMWMRNSNSNSSNGKKKDYRFIERVLDFKEAQVSYFCKFYKIEQEGINQVIRFVSCIKDDELAVQVNGLINYIESWPDPNQIPRPQHTKQQKSIFSLRNESSNSENKKGTSFFRSSTTSPDDSFQIGSSGQSSPNSYSQMSTPICSQSNQNSFFRSSQPKPAQSAPIYSSINNVMLSKIRNDIRYSDVKEISKIPIKDSGESTFNFPTDVHHFFLAIIGINSLIRWPAALEIFIDDKLIKPSGIDLSSNFIDVSELNPKVLKLVNHSPIDQIINISVISANFRSYDQIIGNIGFVDMVGIATSLSASSSDGFVGASPAPALGSQQSFEYRADCLFCPITGKLMKFPGRGINCSHQQCFDLKTFLKIANKSGRFFCPICQKKIEVSQLVISKFALDAVNNIRNSPPENHESGNENEGHGDDIKMIGLTGDDFDMSPEQIFPEIGEPFSLELNNVSFSNDY